MNSLQWTGFVLTMLTTAASQPLTLRVLRARGVLDVPNERSSHATPTPRGGGWGIVAAVLGVTVAGWVSQRHDVPVLPLLGCVLLAAVGAVDDLRGLGAGRRLASQFVAAALIVSGTFGALHTPEYSLAAVIGVLAVVAYVNAFNFMDGINGISAVSGALAAGWLMFLAAEQADPGLVWLAAATAGACVGFLPWNFPFARIFLGDVGSYFLGALLVLLALAVWESGAPLVLCLAPFLIYLFDTGLTLLRRAARGAKLMEAHRDHLYQRLAAKVGHTSATLLVGVLTAACIGAGVVVNAGDWIVGLVASIFIGALYLRTSRQPAVVR